MRAPRPGRRIPPAGAAGLVALGLSGCSGPQSGLDPAGRGAAEVAALFWWMTGGALVVWGAVIWLTVVAIRTRRGEISERAARLYIIGGGALVPTVVLAGLLVYGLGIMPELLAPAPAGSLRISVTSEQWWWRVRYHRPAGAPVELANEIRLPIGEPVAFELESPDVIHSFWIPSLGGKVDMIPGRRTELVLHPTRTGTFRGVCAEYCGMSHALMAFPVVVMEKAEFTRWFEEQQQPAAAPAEPLATQGHHLFFLNGCSACHAIQGTEARGVVGPNLTHVGSRLSLGAGIIPNGHEGFIRWIEQTDQVKPGVHMPHYRMLPPGELNALAAYLQSLQ